jgi:hypothetical protein
MESMATMPGAPVLAGYTSHAVILRSEATKNLSVSWLSIEERFFAALRMTIQDSLSTNCERLRSPFSYSNLAAAARPECPFYCYNLDDLKAGSRCG